LQTQTRFWERACSRVFVFACDVRSSSNACTARNWTHACNSCNPLVARDSPTARALHSALDTPIAQIAQIKQTLRMVRKVRKVRKVCEVREVRKMHMMHKMHKGPDAHRAQSGHCPRTGRNMHNARAACMRFMVAMRATRVCAYSV
jgi:hypothetical protein